MLVLAAWSWQWFGRLDTAVRQLDPGEVITGVVYVGAVVLVQQVIALPFAWYKTFVVENRYGFNRTSGATFVADFVKQFGLVVVIGAPVVAGLMAAFAYAATRRGCGVWACRGSRC